MKLKLLSVLGLTLVSVGPSASVDRPPVATPATTAGPRTMASRDTALAGLPLAAQAAVSTSFGRADAAYHAVSIDGALRMDGPAHGVSATFAPERVAFAAGGAEWGFRLRAFGRADAAVPVPAVEPEASSNRVEYRRASLTEWYVNGPLGVEQGFTVPQRIAGASDAPLRLEMAMDGPLHAEVDAGGQALTLRDETRASRLHYHGLMAQDAAGRSLPAAMRMEGSSVIVSVDDREAEYPVVIDPIVQTARVTASDGAANDQFGNRVAIDGNTLVVGATFHDIGTKQDLGAAYVYTLSGNVWTEQARLTASDGAHLGVRVAISGDTIAVGANSSAVGTKGGQGAVYVFTRSGTVWSQQARLVASDGAASDAFGSGLGISGDTIVVGAASDDIGSNVNQGSAYVFTRTGTVWNEQAKLVASDGAANDQLTDAAISGDTIVLAARGHQVGTNAQQGAAYVFTRSGTVWSQQAELVASDGAALDQLGRESIAISGDTVVLGAYSDDFPGGFGQGSAYVFTRSGTVWSLQAKLIAGDALPGDIFGSDVAIDGETIVVGAGGDDVGAVDQGSAYVFTRSGTVWSQQAKLVAADAAAGDQFGLGVAVSGETFVVGAWARDVGANSNQGAAYVFAPLLPVAHAGADQLLVGCPGCFVSVILDGSASHDPDGEVLQYVWREGANVIATTAAPYSMASVVLGFGMHMIDLTVTNTSGHSSTDTVVVNIESASSLSGPAGAPGATGAQGPAGAQGPTGATGSQGPAGPAGPIGPVGPIGPIGPAGVDGISIAPSQEPPGENCGGGGQKLTPIYINGTAAGPPAFICNGAQGAIGPQGLSGATGATGAQGNPGATGATGANGAVGPAGPIGPVGPAGPQGALGPQGPIGATGPQGTAGAAGAAGDIGPIGPQGLQGPAGANGANGTPGIQGPAGPAGAVGPLGPAGPAGPQGQPGVNGTNGSNGAPGTPGTPGPMGLPGATGATGPAGPAGPGAAFSVRHATADTAVAMPATGNLIYVVTTNRSNITMTLPSAADAPGRMIIIRRDDNGRRVFVRPRSDESIDGVRGTVTLEDRNDGITLISDGDDWVLIYRTR